MIRRLLGTLAITALTALAADVSGKWTGNFEMTDSDGTKQTRPVYLVLKQDGTTLTGSGGPDSSEQHPIVTGTVDGNSLKFTVEGGFIFDVKYEADEIKGDVRRERDGEVLHLKVFLKRAAE
jgi:hypothetical protein